MKAKQFSTTAVWLAFGIFASASANASITEKQIQQDCKKTGSYSNDGNKAYANKHYDKAREHFITQVAWSEFCQESDDKTATAYNNVALTYIHQNAPLKAKAWLMLSPESQKSQYNLGMIKDALAALPTAKDFSGEYWQYAGYGQWNTFRVTPQGSKYQIEFHGLYMTNQALYYGPNYGELSGPITIRDNKAIYKGSSQPDDPQSTCEVSIAFSDNKNKVSLMTDGECLFGANVVAYGDFERVTSE